MDELSVLIADAKAILEQIEQIEAGESGVEPMAEITEPGGEMGPVDGENADIFTEEETKEEEIAKSKRMAKKSFMNETQGDEQSEGTTASDDSDERLLDDLELNEKEIAVAKRLLKKGLISIKTPVNSTAGLVTAFSTMMKAMKSMSNQVAAQGEAIEGMLRGQGYADAVKKSILSAHENRVEKDNRRPVITSRDDSIEEVKKSIEDLKQSLSGGNRANESYDRGAMVRKDIGSVLMPLFGNRS